MKLFSQSFPEYLKNLFHLILSQEKQVTLLLVSNWSLKCDKNIFLRPDQSSDILEQYLWKQTTTYRLEKCRQDTWNYGDFWNLLAKKESSIAGAQTSFVVLVSGRTVSSKELFIIGAVY